MSLIEQSGVRPREPAALTFRPSTEAVLTRNRGRKFSPCSQFQTTPAERKTSTGAIALPASPPSRTTMVTSSTRSACSVGEIRVVRLFRGVFLAMTIRLDIQLDRLPQADDRTDRVKNQCYARDAGDNERVNDDSPAQRGGTADRIFYALYQDIGRPMRGDSFIKELFSQLIDRPDIVAG